MLPIGSKNVNKKMLPIGSRPISSIQYIILTLGEYMEEINKKVGFNIRKYRTKKSWSQEQLALETGLHRAYIGQIERGEKNIGIKNLELIAKTLNIPISKLFNTQ